MTIYQVLSLIITGAIGTAAWIIAFQQLRLNRTLVSEQLRLADAKLKFDLYQKRLALFMLVQDFVSQMAAMNEEFDQSKFYRDIIERYFLFDADENAYIDKVCQKANELKRALARSGPQLMNADEADRLELRIFIQWFSNQSDEMIKVFSKCLSIKTLGQPDSLGLKKVS